MASKMYILLKTHLDGKPIDVGHIALAASHASLGGYLTFVEAEAGDSWGDIEFTLTQHWARTSFRKALCAPSDEQFEKAKCFGVNMKDYRVMTESAFDNAEVAIVFRPVDLDDPNRDKRLCGFLQSLPLYRG